MSKKWKRFGIIILVAVAVLAIFDIAVWAADSIVWNKRVAGSHCVGVCRYARYGERRDVSVGVYPG